MIKKKSYQVSKRFHATRCNSFSKVARFWAFETLLKRSRTASAGNTYTDFNGCGLLRGRKRDSDAPQTCLV